MPVSDNQSVGEFSGRDHSPPPQRHILKKVILLFLALLGGVILAAVASTYQESSNVEDYIKGEMEVKLEIASSILDFELKKMGLAGRDIKALGQQLADFLDYDHKKAIAGILNDQAALNQLDLVILFDENRNPVTANRIIKDNALIAFAKKLIGKGNEYTGLVSVPNLLLDHGRKGRPARVVDQEVLAMVSMAQIVHDVGDIYGYVLLFKAVKGDKPLLEQMTGKSSAEIILADKNNHIMLSSIPGIKTLLPASREIDYNGQSYLVRRRPLKDAQGHYAGYLAVAHNDEQFKRHRLSMLGINLIPFILVVIISLSLLLTLKLRVFDRVQSLIKALRRVASQEGDLSIRVEVPAKDFSGKGYNEIDQMGLDFNRMMEKLQQSRQQLLKASKMEALGTLASGIAHDFNNLLQVIVGCADKAQRKASPGNVALDEIKTAVNRGSELVRQLLTFSSQVEVKFEPIDVNAVVVDTVRLLRHTIPKMIEIQTHLQTELALISADRGQLQQILMNLATNSRDAMLHGGVLVIETFNITRKPDGDLEALKLPPGDYVCIRVADNGSGMDAETLARIFEPFFTTKAVGKGTGLGLSTVYGVVKAHGGDIACQSRLGQGTVFEICLPISLKDMDVKADRSPDRNMASGQGETILLVDDEKIITENAGAFLSEVGYRIITAENGEEALTKYFNSGRVDLVVLDLGMPGMGGVKCLRELLKRDPKATVIVASGYTLADQETESLAAGAQAFLGKPYRMSKMLELIQKILGTKN